MSIIPDQFTDLLQEKVAFANLATKMPDGSPQVTPVWFDYQAGIIRFNTAKGRVKAKNATVGAPVAMSIMDPDNPYRYLQVRGTVRKVTEEGADDHIDALAMKYLGKEKYPFAKPGEVRLTVEVVPVSASGNG
jgi:PPOX class probable F420-dependent enzyme